MPTETRDPTPNSTLDATSTPATQPPAAFAQLLVVLQWMRRTVDAVWTDPALAPARRADASVPCDILLWLVVCAVLHSSVRGAERALRAVAPEILAFWGRATWVDRSAVSRFLHTCDASVLAAWRSLFCPLCSVPA
jgi:hypothetical protein